MGHGGHTARTASLPPCCRRLCIIFSSRANAVCISPTSCAEAVVGVSPLVGSVCGLSALHGVRRPREEDC